MPRQVATKIWKPRHCCCKPSTSPSPATVAQWRMLRKRPCCNGKETAEILNPCCSTSKEQTHLWLRIYMYIYIYICQIFSIAQRCLSVHDPNRIFGHPKTLRRSLGSLGSLTLCQGQCPDLETLDWSKPDSQRRKSFEAIYTISGWWLSHPTEKYESQLGWVFSICGKIKNVPNHQLIWMEKKNYSFLPIGQPKLQVKVLIKPWRNIWDLPKVAFKPKDP